MHEKKVVFPPSVRASSAASKEGWVKGKVLVTVEKECRNSV